MKWYEMVGGGSIYRGFEFYRESTVVITKYVNVNVFVLFRVFLPQHFLRLSHKAFSL